METYFDTGKTSSCCGCGACIDICPKNAITFSEGYDKGFYPIINKEKCINCNACRRVCPITNEIKNDNLFEQKAYVALLKDETKRLQSASGGAFEGIAKALSIKFPNLKIAGAVWGGG